MPGGRLRNQTKQNRKPDSARSKNEQQETRQKANVTAGCSSKVLFLAISAHLLMLNALFPPASADEQGRIIITASEKVNDLSSAPPSAFFHHAQRVAADELSYSSATSLIRHDERSTSDELVRTKRSRSLRPCHTLTRPGNVTVTGPLSVAEKLLLSNIVVQGRLVSRSTVYNSLYFVSFRIMNVIKGRLPRKLRRHVRLMFHVEQPEHGDENQHTTCPFPVHFNVRSDEKYLLYIHRIGPGRYVAVERPDIWARPARRALRKTMCNNCVQSPRIKSLPNVLTVDEGDNVKVKCKVEGNPIPEISWNKDGFPLRPNFRSRIKTKRKRSTLRILNVKHSDAGNYSCSASSLVGDDSKFFSINVRYAAPDPSFSVCPIDSFCLNGGTCLYYQFIGELVCRCQEGFTGQRCQFKKAQIKLPFVEGDACGPYGHDIELREICAAWRDPPAVHEMTKEQFLEWKSVEKRIKDIKNHRYKETLRKFRLAFRRPGSLGPTGSLPMLETMSLVEQPEDVDNVIQH